MKLPLITMNVTTSSNKYIRYTLVLLILLGLNTSVFSAPPLPYQAKYDAQFEGFQARAEMSLKAVDEQNYHESSKVKVSLFGHNLGTIEESSIFSWTADQVLLQEYNYKQRGVSKKKHSIEFDWLQNQAHTLVDGVAIDLPLQVNTFDQLSLYSEIKRQVALGNKDIYFTAIDKDRNKQYHYQVLDEEILDTSLGPLTAIKVVRVRSTESKRTTELWLAKDWSYLLLKLRQRNSNGKESQLNIRKGNVDGVKVTALAL